MAERYLLERESISPEVAELLARVGKALDEQDAERALAMVNRTKLASPWVRNAIGVCQLRLGLTDTAVSTFRSMVVSDNLMIRPDALCVCRINYAVALLLAGNMGGCLNMLAELGDVKHPGVEKLRVALERWKAGLSFWQKIQWAIGNELNEPVKLDFPPGELE